MIHKTVLLHETINALEIVSGDVVVDGTLGGGGHSEEILKRSQSEHLSLTLIALDLDEDALIRSEARLQPYLTKPELHIHFINESFRNIDTALAQVGISHADKILLDLGLSSFQLEESGRGFTFQKDEPLAMTFAKKNSSFNAYDIVNTFDEENMADIIYAYGEEKFSRRIAKAIVEARAVAPIQTTFQLAEIIRNSVPFFYRNGRINPATKTFQALRIAVNDELQTLNDVLTKGFDILSPSGRMAIISFHSLEDRIVKHFFKQKVEEEKATLLYKKPLIPSEEELKENPRARSAKLRTLIKNNQE